MRWEFGRRSTNVEDRRGTRVSAPVVGGGIGAIVLSLIAALLVSQVGITGRLFCWCLGKQCPTLTASS